MRGTTDFVKTYRAKTVHTANVGCGSWLCGNAKLLKDDRRSCSSDTALSYQLAIAFNFKIELKNVILVAFQTFAFSHSQGQSEKNSVRAYVFRFALRGLNRSRGSARRLATRPR
jgi:hypothetical protein